MNKIYAVWLKSNPHSWNSSYQRLIVAYPDRLQADNFVAIHPQHHYRLGELAPSMILEVEEIQLGEILGYWKPSFP